MVNVDYDGCDPLKYMHKGVENIIRSVFDIYFSDMNDEFAECGIYNVRIFKICKINDRLRICVQCYDNDFIPDIRADYVWDNGRWCVILYSCYSTLLCNKFGVLVDAAKCFPDGDELSKLFRDSMYDYQHYFMLITSISVASVVFSYLITDDVLYLMFIFIWLIVNCISASSLMESRSISSFSFLFFLGFVSSSAISVLIAALFDHAVMYSIFWFAISLCYQLSKYQVHYCHPDGVYCRL